MKINKDYLVTDIRKHGGKRKKPITVLIPHHNAGVTAGLDLAKYMKSTSRQLSANYVIGQEGEIFNTLDESLEPYTTGNRDIDTRGVTFEIANSTPAPDWKISDKAFNALVELSIDICKRNGIKSVSYTGDKTGNIHLHEWYQNTNCPGPYVKGRMPEYAKRINAGLGVATPPVTPPTKKTIAQLAKEVLDGLWSSGNDRKIKLEAAGYDYQAVQDEVNRQLYGNTVTKPPVKPPATKTVSQLADEVNKGMWGNGSDRQKRLTDAGYDYNAVQNEINRRLGLSKAKPQKSNYAVAVEVVRGDWGDGQERRARLEAAGYNYNAVQAEVNKMV